MNVVLNVIGQSRPREGRAGVPSLEFRSDLPESVAKGTSEQPMMRFGYDQQEPLEPPVFDSKRTSISLVWANHPIIQPLPHDKPWFRSFPRWL